MALPASAIALAGSGRVHGDVDYRRVSSAYRANLSVLHEVTIHARPGDSFPGVQAGGG